MSNSNLLIFFFLSCFFVYCTSSSSNTTQRCSTRQSVALLLFKRSLFSINDTSRQSRCQDQRDSGSNIPIMMNWNTSTDCCDWNGVTCQNSTGDVIGLDLSCGMLQGTINPNTTLFHLSKLQRLKMDFNDLNLEPLAFINLLQNYTSLEELSLGDVNISSVLPSYLNISSSIKILNLRSTRLQGKLPRSIFNLQHLKKLDLSDNMFTSQIPSEINLPNLVLLDLSYNGIDLHMRPSILSNLLANSTMLANLWLAKVNIGLLLPNYLNISSSLISLDLSSTGLRGKLPDNIFNLEYLEELDLPGNTNIIGALPEVNTSSKNPLYWLDLSLTGLSGEIPSSIGHLESLVYLNFSDCGLIGSLPKSLANLSNLVFLYLSSNKLSGTLPSSLFALPSLEYIRLGNNLFTGNLPIELFSLQSLKGLSVPYNQLGGQIDVLDHGSIPQTFQQLTNLTYINLSNNNFSGIWELDTLLSSLKNLEELHLSFSGLSIMSNNTKHYVNPSFKLLSVASCKLKVFPESLRAMKKIKSLDMSNNDILSPIPDWVGEIGVNLVVLELSNNSISGTIPNVFENYGALEGFILNGNQLEGEVPDSLSKCRNLRILDLGNNRLNDTFPIWLGDLPNLQALVFRSNNFHGPIGTASIIEFPFPSLRVLDLSHNEFVGELPLKYFQNFNAMKNVVKNSTKPDYLIVGRVYYTIIVAVKGLDQDIPKLLVDYTILDLSKNKFESDIPDIIGNLKSLKVLNLSHNSLTGGIPHGLAKLSEIESLDLSSNQLTGEIPASLVDLTFLSSLNLSHNHLVGRIPLGKQFNTFEGNSFGGNQDLCGLPLTKKCEGSNKPQVEGDEHEEEEDESLLSWKAVILGYGCGTLIGLLIGYIMLSTRRPKWFNAIGDAGERMILKWQNK